MVVTTTVEERTPPMRDSYRQLLKVPLSVVPQAEEEAIIEVPEAPSPGETAKGLKNLLQVPLTVLPEGPDAMKSSETIRQESASALNEKLPDETTRIRQIAGNIRKWFKHSVDQEESVDSVVVDVSDDEAASASAPSRPVTIWQLLMQKQKLMLNMAPSFAIPTEEDILERFFVVDLYSRRIFPSLFFIFMSIYWILFNYYIGDEFPEEKQSPSDGLIVT